MDYTKLIENFLRYYENKDIFINKLPISIATKERFKDFFKTHSNLEYKISWLHKDPQVTIKEIEELINEVTVISQEKSNKKETFDFSKINWKEKEFEVLREDEDYIYLIPLSYRACIFANSSECGGQNAEWCIGTADNDYYWDLYVYKRKDAFILLINKNRAKWNYRKFMIEIEPPSILNPNVNEITVWNQLDDNFTLSEIYEKYNITIDIRNGEIERAIKVYNELRNSAESERIQMVGKLPFFTEERAYTLKDLFELTQTEVFKDPDLKTKFLNYTASIDNLIIKGDLSTKFTFTFKDWRPKKVTIEEGTILNSPFDLEELFDSALVEEVDLSKLAISPDIPYLSLSYLFNNCKKLKKVSFPKFDMSLIFFKTHCMFKNTPLLQEVIFDGVIKTDDAFLDSMFVSSNVKKVVLPTIYVSSVGSFNGMFYNTKLKEIDMSSIILKQRCEGGVFVSTFENSAVKKIIMPTRNDIVEEENVIFTKTFKNTSNLKIIDFNNWVVKEGEQISLDINRPVQLKNASKNFIL